MRVILKTLIENHFGFVLIFACVVGLISPWLERVPDASAMVALAMLTYSSCFKLRDGNLSDIRWREIGVFYTLRFVLLPIALWWVTAQLAPSMAMGIFLIALVPSAVSSPAFSSMFGGNVAPAFAIVIISQMLTPLVIPLQFAWLGDMSVAPSPLSLFKSLAFCIFLPMGIYFFTKRSARITQFCYGNNKLISIILVAFVIALVIAKQRTLILENPIALLTPFAIIMMCYALFIAFGWWFSPRANAPLRITYLTCSCFNNVALGVSLALLHFPGPIILLVAISEIAWSCLPILMRIFLSLCNRRMV